MTQREIDEILAILLSKPYRGGIGAMAIIYNARDFVARNCDATNTTPTAQALAELDTSKMTPLNATLKLSRFANLIGETSI